MAHTCSWDTHRRRFAPHQLSAAAWYSIPTQNGRIWDTLHPPAARGQRVMKVLVAEVISDMRVPGHTVALVRAFVMSSSRPCFTRGTKLYRRLNSCTSEDSESCVKLTTNHGHVVSVAKHLHVCVGNHDYVFQICMHHKTVMHAMQSVSMANRSLSGAEVPTCKTLPVSRNRAACNPVDGIKLKLLA